MSDPDLGLKAICQSYDQLFTAIESCIEQKLTLPALMLIYSGIDITAWLASGEEKGVKKNFVAWVEEYMLRAKPLPCTALELYSARCGLLHTMTSTSDFTDGRARHIAYAWGTADVQSLQAQLDEAQYKEQCVALHVNDLFEAFSEGMRLFAEDLVNDERLRERVGPKIDLFFASAPWPAND